MTSIVAVTLGGTPLLLTVGRWVSPLGGVWAGHRRRGPRRLRPLPHPLHRTLRLARRTLGSPLDRPLPVRPQNVHRHRHRLLRRPRRRRHVRAHRSPLGHALARHRQPARLLPQSPRRTHHRNALDHPRRHLPGQHRHAVVGLLVSRRRTRWRRLHRPAHLQCPRRAPGPAQSSSGSTSPTTPSAPGRGSSPPSRSSSSTPASPIPKPASCWS